MSKKNKIVYAVNCMRPRNSFDDLPYSNHFYVEKVDGDRIVQLIGQYEMVDIQVFEPDRGVPDGKE